MKHETCQETLRTNNNNTRTKGRTPAEFTPRHLVKRSNMCDLDPYALNAIITTTVRVLRSAATATKLAILRVTVGVRQIPIMLTIRGALGQARNRDVMSVEFKDILIENVLSCRTTTTRATKVEGTMLRLGYTP
nr:hypothetical protein [Tanacetum cinerariifolium]